MGTRIFFSFSTHFFSYFFFLSKKSKHLDDEIETSESESKLETMESLHLTQEEVPRSNQKERPQISSSQKRTSSEKALSQTMVAFKKSASQNLHDLNAKEHKGESEGGEEAYKPEEIPILDERYKFKSTVSSNQHSTLIKVLMMDTTPIEELLAKVYHKGHDEVGRKEVKLLNELGKMDPNDNGHVARLAKVVEEEKHLCLVFTDDMEPLPELIKSMGNSSFDLSHIRIVASQILVALMLLSQNKIIHGNLTLDNIFVSFKNHQKLLQSKFGVLFSVIFLVN